MSVLHMCMCIMYMPHARGSQNNGWNWNYRQLWTAMWALGIKPRPSARRASVLNCWIISSQPWLWILRVVLAAVLGQCILLCLDLSPNRERQKIRHTLGAMGYLQLGKEKGEAESDFSKPCSVSCGNLPIISSWLRKEGATAPGGPC